MIMDLSSRKGPRHQRARQGNGFESAASFWCGRNSWQQFDFVMPCCTVRWW